MLGELCLAEIWMPQQPPVEGRFGVPFSVPIGVPTGPNGEELY